MMKALAWTVAIAGLALGLGGAPAAVLGAAFEVEGEVTKTLSEPPPSRGGYEGEESEEETEEPQVSRYRFVVTVHGERYFIRLDPLFNQTAPEPRYIEVGFDGEQQYVYRRSGRYSTRDADGVEHIVDLGYLSWEKVPLALADAVCPPLWLAFASGEHLGEGPHGRLPPLWMEPVMASLVVGISYPCAFELLAGPGSLPMSVILRTEGISYFGDPVKGLQRIRLAPPEDKGYVVAEYTVRETLTMHGMLLPRRASFRKYATFPGKPGQELEHRLVYEVDIRVTNAQPSVRRTSFVPAIVTKTTIVDGRREGNPVEADYAATSWPRFDDRLVQYAFREADQRQRQTLDFWAQLRTHRLSRLLFFAVLTAMLVVLVAQWLRRKPKLQ
jgi:hypothetical protein